MDVTVHHVPESHRYELRDAEGQRIGLIDYRLADGIATMWHTEVDPAHGGKGYGNLLVTGALDDARAQGLKVRPTCPFIKKYIERHPEYGDLLAP